MVQAFNTTQDRSIPTLPILESDEAFDGLGEIFELIAVGLYSLASMLVGEGEESMRVVEEAIASAKVSPCADPLEARASCQRTVGNLAIAMLAERDAVSLTPPAGLTPASVCIEEDDLASVGISNEELDEMISGPERDRVREWLASLPVWMRTVFVLRSVAGFTAAETATLLQKHGGPRGAGWSAEMVREVYRQGLCSLASQLLKNRD